VQDRIFFWNVAVDMIKSNPIFGVGVDSYGDWFGRFSLFEQNQSYSYSGTSNNAHSVLLQISSTTGLITGLSYLLFLIIVFYRAIQNCKLYSGNITFYALFTVWLLWVIQSFFSIDNLGVSIWGWSVSGIIGTFKAPHLDLLKKSSKVQFISIGKIRVRILTVLVVTFLTLPSTYLVNNLANEVRIRTSIIRFMDIPIKNVNELDLNSKQLLLLGTQSSDPELRMYVAKYLLRKNSMADALELISLTTKEFPNYSNAWNLQAIIYENLKQFDKAIGPRKMTTILEPRNKRHLENLNKDLTELGIK
jgi:tetratricopeptide (TPR) repeat protein